MKHAKKAWAAGLLAAASLGAVGISRADFYTEPGDVGQTLATAPDAGAATGFNGTLGTAQDADLFRFTVSTAGTYTFSDANTLTIDTTADGPLDTAIFLLTSTGAPLVTNDDASGTLSTSSFTTTLTAGTYYFGISESGNEPINSANQLLFAAYPGGDPSATRGPANGLNPAVESTFNGQSYSTDLGNYSVSIAAVPEPSAWAFLGLGGAAVVGCTLRRRQTSAV